MRSTTVASGLSVLLGWADPAASQHAYWTNSPNVERAAVGSAIVETVVAGVSGVDLPTGITLHDNTIYWIDATHDIAIKRADLDGSNVETVLEFTDSVPEDVTTDPETGKLYWTDRVSGSGRINRCNPDGSAVETFAVGGKPVGVAVHVSTGRVYWSDAAVESGGKIRFMEADGSGLTDVVTALVNPAGIAIAEDRVYWADGGAPPLLAGTIERADLNGGNREVLVNGGDGLQSPQGVTLDECAGLMYWSDRSADRIQRANMEFLSGEIAGERSDVEDLVNDLVNIAFAVLDGGCDDGDACTEQDTCHAAVCAGSVIDCNDGNDCTLDYCGGQQCVHEPLDGDPCDDGQSCTGHDVCVDDHCIGTTKRDILIHSGALGLSAGDLAVVSQKGVAGLDIFVFQVADQRCLQQPSWSDVQWWHYVLYDCNAAVLVDSATTGDDGVATLHVPSADFLVIGGLDPDGDGEYEEVVGGNASAPPCGGLLGGRLGLVVTPRGEQVRGLIFEPLQHGRGAGQEPAAPTMAGAWTGH